MDVTLSEFGFFHDLWRFVTIRFRSFACRSFQCTGWQIGTLAQECLQRPEGELDEELADFLKHCQINPGRPYKAPEIFGSRLNQDSRCGDCAD